MRGRVRARPRTFSFVRDRAYPTADVRGHGRAPFRLSGNIFGKSGSFFEHLSEYLSGCRGLGPLEHPREGPLHEPAGVPGCSAVSQ